MSLPNEIDQDVRCVDCGTLMVQDGNRYLICTHGGCRSYERIGPMTIAALRNQLPQGHTAIPNAELEALRKAADGDGNLRTHQEAAMQMESAARAILAHLPKKPDHVAVLRRMAKDNCPHGEERAALEAAIKAMEKP